MFNCFHGKPSPFEGDVVLFKGDKPVAVFVYNGWGTLEEILSWKEFFRRAGIPAKELLNDCDCDRHCFDDYILIPLVA